MSLCNTILIKLDQLFNLFVFWS